MLHQQTLHLVQSGAKYFFDIDPVLTEHVFRNLFFQAAIVSCSAGLVIQDLGDKFTDGLSPMLNEIRNLKLSIPGF
jgi:hypothetical protein